MCLFAITLRGTFIEDDVLIVREDPRLYEPGQWLRLMHEEYWPDGSVDNLYRPLTSLSFALQWHLLGRRPPPTPDPLAHPDVPYPADLDAGASAFHLVNWLLAGVVAAMVAELARRLTRRNGPAYLAGLLFAAHPVHVEVVAGVVGRAEMLCAAGILGALILALHRPITMRRAVSIFFCLLIAIFSKEQGMLLPLLLILLPLALGIDRPRDERERLAVLWMVMGVCWFTAAYFVIREHYLPFDWEVGFADFSQQPLVRCSPRDRLLMPLVLMGHYAQLIAMPMRLSIDYGGRVIGWVVRMDDPFLYIGIAVLTAACTAALALLRAAGRQARAALFCLLAAGALYGMVGNIVGLIGTNFGERLMYLPSVFLAILGGIVLNQLSRVPRIAIAAVVLILLSARTVTYAAQWNDRLHFYELQAASNPTSVRLHMLVAVESLARGKLDEAREADARARAALPDYVEAWVQSAQVAMARGDLDEAEQFIRRAWQIKPSAKVIHWWQLVKQAKQKRSLSKTG